MKGLQSGQAGWADHDIGAERGQRSDQERGQDPATPADQACMAAQDMFLRQESVRENVVRLHACFHQEALMP